MSESTETARVDAPTLNAIKKMLAHGRQECGRALSGVTGVVLSDEDFTIARAEYAARYAPADPAFAVRHPAWFDILTANGKTRIFRQGAFTGLLFQFADSAPVA